MDEQACPRCKTTKYRNPLLKLLVNVCGHTLCESCVELIFPKGSGACPDCHTPLRRNNFRVQVFEDPVVEKEIDIRRRILRDYNKKEDDFPTLLEYNDYLEEIECLVFNLCNNIDIIETNKRIEAYKRENREQIKQNKSRIGRDEIELEELLALERLQTEQRNIEMHEHEVAQKKMKLQIKEAFIDELMNSEQDANAILSVFTERAEKQIEEEKTVPPPKSATQFSSGIKFTRRNDVSTTVLPKEPEGPLFTYEQPELPWDGPPPPTLTDINSKGFMEHVRTESVAERAGGYRATFACQRALQEALQGLYHSGSMTPQALDSLERPALN